MNAETKKSASGAVRTCGGCTVCCVAAAVEPLAKPCGVACENLGPAGCTIYDHRQDPKFRDCISFRCMWLQGDFAEEDRPDKLGVMFVRKDDPNRPGYQMVHIVESHVGAAINPRVKALIRQFVQQEGLLVLVQNSQFAIAMEPNGDSWQYMIDVKDPLHANVDKNIPRVQLTARGRPVIS